MRIVRFTTQRRVKYGLLEHNAIRGLRGIPFAQFSSGKTSFTFDGRNYNPGEVKLLAPCVPSKIVCLALNYRNHAEEAKRELPNKPLIFLKPPTAIIGPDDNIVLPRLWKRVDYEGELGVVIGKRAKNVSQDRAKDYVLGFTCFNDVSDRIAAREDGQLARGKGYDTFAPIGPWIETELNPGELKLETYLNGELRQSANTSSLIFGVSELISFISSIMTLLPGDVIATGTPAGIGQINPGDVVEVRIDGIGTLRNSVVEER